MSEEQMVVNFDRPVPFSDKSATIGTLVEPESSGQHVRGGYRGDIDGLRAIAVGLVLLYHTGVTPLRGGFIGVDIFFVISGYLITRLLRDDFQVGAFYISSFYERRILRILPALLCVTTATLLAAPFLLFPVEQKTTALTAIAALLSSSNLYLLGSGGYFGADTLSQPLLHTWSLGVEEQFYLVFPLLLMALVGMPVRATRWIIGAILLASLAAGVGLAYVNRDYAYYFPLTRAWEMLAGGALAFVPPIRFNARVAQVATASALALLLACAVKFHSGLAFPGFYAVAPCIAAAAIILFGSHNRTAVGDLLSSTPFRWGGKISYSVYLWHWPILIYYQLATGRSLTATEAGVLCIVIIAISVLSWRFIEQPFRGRKIALSSQQVWTAALLCSSLVATGAAGLLVMSSNPSAGEANRLAAYLNYDENPIYRKGTCFLFGHIDKATDFDAAHCLAASPSKPNVLIIGDSHAAHLWPGLNATLPNMNVMQATATGCKPVLDLHGERGCTRLMKMIFDDYLPSQRIDLLILSARWIDQDTIDVVKTVEALRSKVGKIVVFGPIVEYGHPLPRLLGQAAWRNDPAILLSARSAFQPATDTGLSRAVQAVGASYISTYKLLCRDDSSPCTTMAGDVPVQWDYGHLTAEGSALVARRAVATGLLSAGN